MEAVQIETPNLTQTVKIDIGEDEKPQAVVYRLIHALGVGNVVRIRGETFLVQSVRPPIVAVVQDDAPSSHVRESQPPTAKIDWFGDGFQPDPLPVPEVEVPAHASEPEAPQKPAGDTLRCPENKEAKQEAFMGMVEKAGPLPMSGLAAGPYEAYVGSKWLPKDPRRKQVELTVVAIEGEQVVMDDGRKIQVERLKRYNQVGLPAVDDAG
jgi:hypothetical protein